MPASLKSTATPEPPSPAPTTITFQSSTSTMNAIATRPSTDSARSRSVEPSARSERLVGVDDSQRGDDAQSVKTTASSAVFRDDPLPLEPTSPSNSTDPVLVAAADLAGHDFDIEEKSLHRVKTHSSVNHGTHPSTIITTTTTPSQTEADAHSTKSKASDAALALPTVAAYPPAPGGAKADTEGVDELAPPDGGLRAWLNVVGGFLVLFASFGYTNAFGVYQAYYSQTIYRRYSDSAISWIGSVQLCLFFVLALVAGPLFDKGRFRFLIAFGSAIQITSIFLIPECDEFWQTMLVQGVMSGAGIGLLFLPALSIQSHWFLRRRATAIGIVACGSSVGGIAFPIMLNKLFVNPSVGFPTAFEPVSFALQTPFLNAWPSIDPFTFPVRSAGYVVAACLAVANVIMAPHPARLVAKKPPLPPLKKILTPVYLCMTIGAFLLNWGLWMPLFYLQLYAQSKGVSANLSFYTLAVYNAGSVFGRTIPNVLADHLGAQNLQSFCCVGAGIALFGMNACETVAGIYTFAAVYGFLSGGFISLVSPAIISISDDINEIGLRQGVAFLIVAGGAVGGNPVCGKLLEVASNDFVAPIMFAAAMALIGGIVTTAGRFLRAREKGTWRV